MDLVIGGLLLVFGLPFIWRLDGTLTAGPGFKLTASALLIGVVLFLILRQVQVCAGPDCRPLF